MLNKLAFAFCALLALSGCSTTSKTGSMDAETEFRTQVGDRVHFEFNSDKITDESREALDRQVEWLNSNKRENIQFVVEGHCDERGTREYNLALGERRANSVRSYMVSKGIDPTRLEVISYGKERPAAIGDTEEVYKLNRRGVTVLK
jgi:peptidoglycan-associated lipoprotein